MKIKKLLSAVIFFFTSTFLFAQEIDWQNTIGGDGSDAFPLVSQTFDGGYIIGGVSNSGISGDKTEISMGASDYWVVKLDNTGSIQWQNTINANGDDYLTAISQTSDGGYILGGYSDSNISGDKTENTQGNNDYWVIKLDGTGLIQWQNTIGGNANDRLMSICQTTDGGYILGGHSESNISGDKTENSMGSGDFWVVRLDNSGAIQWQNTIGGNNADGLYSISQTSDGGFILGGRSDSYISGDKTENSQGQIDYWVVKLDGTGIIQWQNTIGGNSYNMLCTIVQTSDGGYITGGYSDSGVSGDKTEACQGNEDFWIIKLDNLGSIQWQNTIGSSSFDLFESILQTTDGGYMLGGSTAGGISGDKTEIAHTQLDYWVIKLDTLGQIEWQNSLGGSHTDQIKSLSQTTDGGYILGGLSTSDISGDKTEASFNYTSDFWIIKLTCKYNLIQGNEFIDLNSNSTSDLAEPAASYKKIVELNTARITYADHDGNYSLAVLDSGNYQVTTADVINYYNAVPIIHNVNFISLFAIDSLNDFAFQPTGSFNDLCVGINPVTNFRPAMSATYVVQYSNQGTTALNGTVVFYPDINVAYTSANTVPIAITPDSIVFDVGLLTPLTTGQIYITVIVGFSVNNGTLINSKVRIFPVVGDVNPGCNFGYWEVFTTGSYDPNDIQVNRSYLYDYEIPNEPELEYIIRFQNTGNDTAFTVKILNPVDTTRLQLNTLEIVSTSHPASITWIPWEQNMEFLFENILLPDSNVNELLSHGYIRYKIKSKANLLVGDSITNQAFIYFDFNNPVQTNNAVTDIILYTGIGEYGSSGSFNIYPNPVGSTLNVQVPGSHKHLSLELYNMYGQLVTILYEGKTTGSLNKSVDVSKLPPGIYIIRLNGDASIVRRFVKN